jgi:branched-chain amino acid transport system ATP-binding protein
MTVLENVLVGALHGSGLAVPEAEAKAIEALPFCGMRRVANRRAATLGLLDRKRLELARALATEPELLLLDEIGGGLTDGEAGELLETIRQVQRQGVTIVWIEHRVHILTQIATRLVCMDAGRIIADGIPAAVLSDPAVLDAYFGDSVPCPA